jgi:hypothetical protein
MALADLAKLADDIFDGRLVAVINESLAKEYTDMPMPQSPLNHHDHFRRAESRFVGGKALSGHLNLLRWEGWRVKVIFGARVQIEHVKKFVDQVATKDKCARNMIEERY